MNTKQFSKIVLILILIGGVTGCENAPTSAQIEMKQNEDNQMRLIKSIPAPTLKTSLERKNLVRRLERINQEEMVSYVYLVSYGKVMAYYTIRGKVSSLNSYLTAMERLERVSSGGSTHIITLEAPDQDGSYGNNADGVFFFTTEGVYVEWKGEYLWSDQPLKMSQPVEMIQVISGE
ncbi:MAG TPA: hypothetical protein PKA60_01210 [Candidatus Paceibacterota bacterium]|nr:hypothetical protein [Candidatus Paceibacterota bacterium]